MISFNTWEDKDNNIGLKNYIIQQTGCKPYSGAGICNRVEQETSIIKSVDDTYYYNDDLTDIDNPRYTLFGHDGDQDANEKKFNEPLLNNNKVKHIYLYRVKIINKTKREYIWYGKYKIVGQEEEMHIGKNRELGLRKIIILLLKKID